MFNSEMIVVLWFVPVVLSIVIPLAMLCIWSVQQVLKRVADTLEQAHRSAKEARKESRVGGYRTRHAV
jgi:hypothetical protein